MSYPYMKFDPAGYPVEDASPPDSPLAKWQRGEDIGIPEPLTEPEQPQATGPAMMVTITFPSVDARYAVILMEILERRGLLDAADEYSMQQETQLHYPDDTLYRDLDEWCRDAWGCGLIRDWKIER